MDSNDLASRLVSPFRRIVRAIELQSRNLVRRHGLTGPQTMLLRELRQTGPSTVGNLAERVSLSQATVTDILNRLEARSLVSRVRSEEDKRRVQISLTAAAIQMLEGAPPILHEKFLERFHALNEWEQLQIVSTLQRLAEMMDARDIEPRAPAATPVAVGGLDALPAAAAASPVNRQSP